MSCFLTVYCETVRDEYRCKTWVGRWTAEKNFPGGNLLSRPQSLKCTYPTAQLLDLHGCIKNFYHKSFIYALFKNGILCSNSRVFNWGPGAQVALQGSAN